MCPLPSDGCNTQFEKKHGERQGIEDVLVSKRRFAYEEQVKENPHNYDAWFDFIRLEEGHGDMEKTRDVYERAIANLPPSEVCTTWSRMILFLLVLSPMFAGEAPVAKIYVPVDILRGLRRAGGEGMFFVGQGGSSLCIR